MAGLRILLKYENPKSPKEKWGFAKIGRLLATIDVGVHVEVHVYGLYPGDRDNDLDGHNSADDDNGGNAYREDNSHNMNPLPK